MLRFLPAVLVEAFCLGIEQFNKGEYFECHETLESVWRQQQGDYRELTQGIIQVAVACHHLQRSNKVGALKLFQRGLTRLEKFKKVDSGLELRKLCGEVSFIIKQTSKGAATTDKIILPQLEFASRHRP